MVADIWRQAVALTTFALIFSVSACVAIIVLTDVSIDPQAKLLIGVLITIVYFIISVFVHEIGHAIVARLVGWRVHLIAVGSWTFLPRRKKIFRMSRNSGSNDLAGWVLATPPQESGWDKGTIPFFFGGAAGNLLSGVLLIFLALAMYEEEFHYSVVLIGLAASSVLVAAANLVPTSRRGAWRSDGGHLWEAIKGESWPDRERRIARLYGAAFDGIPIEEWDASALKDFVNETPSDGGIDPLLISYAFAMADLATAKVVLDRYLKANSGSSLDYQCMYAFVIAMTDRDALRASKVLEKLPNHLVKKSFSFWRAKAVTAHLLEKRVEALEAVRKARHFAGKIGASPDGDDELVFHAIEQDETLPHFEPRALLFDSGKASLARGGPQPGPPDHS